MYFAICESTPEVLLDVLAALSLLGACPSPAQRFTACCQRYMFQSGAAPCSPAARRSESAHQPPHASHSSPRLRCRGSRL